MPPMTGRVIAGRYNLQHPIGRGAMGVVWRAHDRLLDREVAVKEVVISALIGAEERRNAYQRTLREARTAARLSHRGVVAVYDVAEEDGRPWIVMELVPSQSLDQLLVVEGRLPAARLARDCITKVEVLEYPELGMEAVWQIEVRDFPAFIIVDDKGNDFFAETLRPVATTIPVRSSEG